MVITRGDEKTSDQADFERHIRLEARSYGSQELERLGISFRTTFANDLQYYADEKNRVGYIMELEGDGLRPYMAFQIEKGTKVRLFRHF